MINNNQPNNMKEKVRKPFKDTKFWKFTKGVILDTAELLPVVGPIAKSIKENTPQNPKGQVRLSKGKWYKILVGLGAVIYLWQQYQAGALTPQTLHEAVDMIAPLLDTTTVS